MPAAIDLVGRKFGRLAVVARSAARSSRILWECRCDCGAAATVAANNLSSGNTKSCGCLLIEVKRSAKKHGHAKAKSAEYKIWCDMRHRCADIDNKDYGGRGIAVCDRWEDFGAFYSDMGKRPRRTDTIERIDNDGDYEPGNCRWATRREQANNRRSNRIVEFRGAPMPLKDAARLAGLPYLAVWLRIVRRGWSVQRALSEPIR